MTNLNAKYSVLSTDRRLISSTEEIEYYLSKGIKVVLFGTDSWFGNLESLFKKYVNVRLLQLYTMDSGCSALTIYDGIMTEEERVRLNNISSAAPEFNLEQYVIEHYNAQENMIVEAGAGTGKTTVMIDRIMFLLHTVPELLPEDIGMITFTNDATQHMKHKIQKELMNRYKATGLAKYLVLLENCGSLRIQTIDSFSKDFISEFGSSIGYGCNVSLRGYTYEKRKLILQILNRLYGNQKKRITESLGLPIHELEKLLLEFWGKLEQLGISDADIALIDWGQPYDDDSTALHNTLSNVFTELCVSYNELKSDNNAISVSDIVRELDHIISSGNVPSVKSHALKYLFVDEFQDADNSQIRTIAWMQKNQNLNLFTVGDVKQSIYRFRGAVDTAFEKLKESLGEYKEFTLVRNYRTSKDILEPLDTIFTRWKNRDLLNYDMALQAQKRHPGMLRRHDLLDQPWLVQTETIRCIISCLEDCRRTAEQHGKLEESSQRVAVLTRTNWQLGRLAEWCEAAGIPCHVKREGSFFSSRAVLDFFTVVRAYTFPASMQCLLDYAMSPYVKDNIDLNELGRYQPGSKAQVNEIITGLESSGWHENLKRFRIRPVLSVLEEIITEICPMDRFAAVREEELIRSGSWAAAGIENQILLEMKQYQANLDKLMQLLRTHFSGQMSDLYSIYSYLKLNITTNREEDEPDISDHVGINCVYGLTVHKSKGLEFDTVIVPFTDKTYRRDVDTEIIFNETIRPIRVGWSKVEWADKYHNELISQLSNNYYRQCVRKEFTDMDREEARLLYVALTRSIRRLEYFVTASKEHNWAGLLE